MTSGFEDVLSRTATRRRFLPPMLQGAVALPTPSETVAAGLSSPHSAEIRRGRVVGRDGLHLRADDQPADRGPRRRRSRMPVLTGFVEFQSLPALASSRPLPAASIAMRSTLSRSKWSAALSRRSNVLSIERLLLESSDQEDFLVALPLRRTKLPPVGDFWPMRRRAEILVACRLEVDLDPRARRDRSRSGLPASSSTTRTISSCESADGDAGHLGVRRRRSTAGAARFASRPCLS